VSASPLLTAQDPRDVDNVLLRVPAGLRRRVSEKAKDKHLSQNAFITASLLYSAVVFGELPQVGMPKNIMTLLAEMDRAVKDKDAVLGAFHEHDWADVRPLIELFASSGIIDGVKARRDTLGAETIAFTFHFTKTGAAAWEVFGPMFRSAVENMERERGYSATGAGA